MMDKETELLVKKVKEELQMLRAKVVKSENHEALKAYEKLKSTMD